MQTFYLKKIFFFFRVPISEAQQKKICMNAQYGVYQNRYRLNKAAFRVVNFGNSTYVGIGKFFAIHIIDLPIK